jgi:hypothetical protein
MIERSGELPLLIGDEDTMFEQQFQVTIVPSKFEGESQMSSRQREKLPR